MARFALICRSVNIRFLFAMLIAAAMLFAPMAMQEGRAMAAATSPHHGQSMEAEHCGEQPATGQDGEAADKPCCVGMCTAIAVDLVAPAELAAFERTAEPPMIEKFGRSFLTELATPPPRRA